MLDDLKFVKGAVAKKDFVPELTHFCIRDGRITGYNGRIGLSSKIDLDLEVYPKAIPFTKAIEACKAETTMTVTPTGRISIVSGKFRALVECSDGVYPDIEPEGEIIELSHGIIEDIKLLAPFIAEDASRPWARGILMKGGSAYATNNIVLIQKHLGYPFPITVNIPAEAIKELLRVKQEPTHLQVTDKSLTFHFENERWIKTNLLDLAWPDAIDSILPEAEITSPSPPSFYEAVELLFPFADELDRVYFADGKVCTSPVAEEGTNHAVDIPLPENGVYNAHQLASLKGVATGIDLTAYPSPCPFTGVGLRGVIIGMRNT